MPGTSPGMTAVLFRRLDGVVGRRRRFGGGLGGGLVGGFLGGLFSLLFSLLGGGVGLGALLDHAHRNDRALVQEQQRHGERHLADHVWRRQHGGQNEGGDDEVAPLLLE